MQQVILKEAKSIMKRPAFQFYPSDWRKDSALQTRSLAARGLWTEMICIMHECLPYGHLSLNGKPMDTASLARLVGEYEETVKGLLEELESAGVFSRTEQGCIYSRRMLKDEATREERSAFGKLGGNPSLVKRDVNHQVNVNVKPLMNHQDNHEVKPTTNSALTSRKAKLKKEVKSNLTPSSSSSLSISSSSSTSFSSLASSSSSNALCTEINKDAEKAIVIAASRDDDCPQNEDEWASYFVKQDGQRKKVWPFFIAWCAAGVTIRQVNQAINAAREKSSEPVACLPAYVNSVLASQARELKQGRAPKLDKQAALEAHNARITSQWLDDAMEVKNASAG